MKEILTMGDITEDFTRLNIKVVKTYKGEDYGVYEVTEEEFEILCKDEQNENGFDNCGWRYAIGSNKNQPDKKIIINKKEIIAWYDDSNDFDNKEERECYLKEHNGVMPLERFSSLLDYLCYEMGCSSPRNVCALAVDLAKYNNIKLSELFKIYQG